MTQSEDIKKTEINDELKILIEKYICDLQAIKNNINACYINTIKMNTSNDSKNTELLKSIKNNVPMIYIIKTKEKIDIEEVKNAKKDLKAQGFGMFRINYKKINNESNQSKYLYVGSSQKLRDRLKQHLGLISKTTFALHLKEWWKNREIEIEIYEIKDSDNMQLYEDLLWQKYKPIFGREGKK